jgi:hypothetical protein
MAMKYRSLRYFKTTQVLPSLKINAFTRPSTRGLNEFILGVEVILIILHTSSTRPPQFLLIHFIYINMNEDRKFAK